MRNCRPGRPQPLFTWQSRGDVPPNIRRRRSNSELTGIDAVISLAIRACGVRGQVGTAASVNPTPLGGHGRRGDLDSWGGVAMLTGAGLQQFGAGQSRRAGTFAPRISHPERLWNSTDHNFPTVHGRTP